MKFRIPMLQASRTHLRRWFAVVLGVVLIACTEEPTTPDVIIRSVDLTPPTATVRAGTTLALAVTIVDDAGNSVDNRPVLWSSSNPALATVSASGVVSANAPGSVQIAASVHGKSATAQLTITPREVANVQVTPVSIAIRMGSNTQLQGLPVDAEGNPLTGRTVTWTSSNTNIATVNAQGVVTGIAPGTSTLTATSEGKLGSSAVTVTPIPVATVSVSPSQNTMAVGTDTPLAATTRDDAGAILTGRAISWSSTNVQVATVSSNGVVTALTPGSVTISAFSEGQTGTATVTVLARLADAVTLTPGSNTVIVGESVQLATQVTDPVGNLLTGRPVSYSSDNQAVATVNATGLVTAISPGSARITATSEGKTGFATVLVIPVPVATVLVSPPTGNVFAGTTLPLTAIARSASGTILTGRPVTWTSGAPSVASIASTGLVTGLSPGVALILAVMDGVAGTATITVTLPTIVSVSITPQAPAINVSSSFQLTATPRDALGNALTGRTLVWTSADENIAFVSSTGVVIGVRTGTVAITATSEGVSGSTVVTVR